MSGEKLHSKNDYRQAGAELYEKLHLLTYPISIKYIKEGSKSIKGLTKPSSIKQKMTICQAFTMSRTFGLSYMITAEDNFCTPSSLSHGWLKLSLEDLIESQIEQGWHKDEKSERRRFQNLLFNVDDLINEGYFGLACCPLLKTKFIPDTILIYGDGLQLMHIIQALCYEYLPECVPNSTFEGYGESCVKGGLIPYLTQKPQVVIPGAGGRGLAGIQNDELAIGIPAHLIFYMIENLFKSGGFLNLGFPAKRILASNLTEEFTPGFELLKKKLEKK